LFFNLLRTLNHYDHYTLLRPPLAAHCTESVQNI
jgi:hypothetical protein